MVCNEEVVSSLMGYLSWAVRQIRSWCGNVFIRFHIVEEAKGSQCVGVEWSCACGIFVQVPGCEACVVVAWKCGREVSNVGETGVVGRTRWHLDVREGGSGRPVLCCRIWWFEVGTGKGRGVGGDVCDGMCVAVV